MGELGLLVPVSCVPARCLCGTPAWEADPGKENGRRKGKAWFLGVSSARAGLLPGLMSSRVGTKEGHWPGQGSWQPVLLLAWAPIVNVTPGSG